MKQKACPPNYASCWRGFTLAELMVTVSIVVILGMSLLLTINPLTQFLKGYDTVRKADLAKIKNAFEAYYSDHDCYPPTSVLSQCGSDVLAPYLSVIPCDPNTKEPYKIYLGVNESVTCPQKYAVYANLANKLDPSGDEIRFCPDTIVSSSSESREADIIKGCSDISFVSTYYGCQNGTCRQVSQDYDPPPSECNKVWEQSDCESKCSGKYTSGKLKGQYNYYCNL